MKFTDIKNKDWADEALGPVTYEYATEAAVWSGGVVTPNGIRVVGLRGEVLCEWGNYILRQGDFFGATISPSIIEDMPPPPDPGYPGNMKVTSIPESEFDWDQQRAFITDLINQKEQ